MTEHDAFPSTYLGKDDLDAPVIAIIGDVTTHELRTDDGGTERKAVIVFDGEIKPLIVNRVNWRTLADAYGADSDDWRGKPVEIYVDPNVTFGLRRVGGVRVRIPAGHRTPSRPSTPNGTPRPTAKPLPAQNDLETRKAQAIRGMIQSDTPDTLEEWRSYYNAIQFTEAQFAELDGVYDDRLQELGLSGNRAAAPFKPALSRT